MTNNQPAEDKFIIENPVHTYTKKPVIDLENEQKKTRLVCLLSKASKFSEWLSDKMASEPIQAVPIQPIEKGRKLVSKKTDMGAGKYLIGRLMRGLRGIDVNPKAVACEGRSTRQVLL
jgi:hypothetical protein